jgi:hypothetical protein
MSWLGFVYFFMTRHDELPHEVILSINRILDIRADGNGDPLDTLENDFSPVDLLNSFFPDGMKPSFEILLLNSVKRHH